MWLALEPDSVLAAVLGLASDLVLAAVLVLGWELESELEARGRRR
jgi:hypothetical protein